jgi:Tfp pilus assembly protein PilX
MDSMHKSGAGNKQRGVASVITVVLLAIVVMLVLLVSVRVSTSGVNDTLNQSDSVAALFLAESGLENATQRLSSATASCDATLASIVSGLGAGGFSIDSGFNTDYDNVSALPATQCRVQVTGTVSASNVSRTVQGIVEIGSGASGISLDNSDSRDRNNQSTLSWNFTTAGVDRLLLVGVSLRRDNSQTVSSVTYGGVPLSKIDTIDNDPQVRVEMWYLVAPALGSNSLSINVSDNSRFVAGVVSFDGVDQTTPLELSTRNFSSGLGIFPHSQVTTTTDNAWVVATLGVESNSGQILGFGQTALWDNPSPGNPRIQGAGAYYGPVSPAASVTMWWLRSYDRWAVGAVAIRPATGGSGLLSWREIVQ